MKQLGIYHKDDLDGLCSAAILLHEMPEIELYGMTYGDKVPWDLIKGREVYMCDFSLDSMEDMWRTVEVSEFFVWIDHHVSAIKRYEEKVQDVDRPFIFGKREIGKSGCELTWEFFHPDEEIPEFIELLGAYDTWRNADKIRWNDCIVPFEYGMLSNVTTPSSLIWKALFFEPDASRLINNIMEKGRVIVAYNKQADAAYAEDYSYEADFEGLRAICINSTKHSSLVLESVYDPAKHDIMVVYTQLSSGYRVSLYATKPEVDCSKIAVKYGGGGHAPASGFATSVLPFQGEHEIQMY